MGKLGEGFFRHAETLTEQKVKGKLTGNLIIVTEF